MKCLRFNFLTFAAITISMLLFTGCPKDEEPTYLEVSTNKLTFTSDETGEKSITVSSNDAWSFTKSGDWIAVSKRDDNKLYVTAQNYTNTSSSRTATITITADDLRETITIEQSAKPINGLSVSPASISYEADEKGEKTATINTDSESWDATTDASWVKLSKQDKTLKVTVDSENPNPTQREAVINISAGNAPDIKLAVKQAGKSTLTVSPKTLSYEAKETGNKNVTITTNETNWNATKTESWITLTKQDNTLIVNVTEKNNETTERKAEIIIKAGDAPEQTVTVTQGSANPSLSVSPNSLSYEADETGKQNVTITTNISSWDATKTESWITLTKQDNTLIVNVTEKNNATTARTASIKVTAGDAPEQTVTVTQEAINTLSVSPDLLLFGAEETVSKNVTITTNASSWNATKTASWITLTKQNNTLVVNVSSKNTAKTERTAEIKITAGSAPEQTVTVTQYPNEMLTVSPKSLLFGPKETKSQSVTIETNVSNWDATTADSWITLTKQNNTLDVKVSNNNETTERTASIKFTAGSAPEQTVTVIQEAPETTLSISTSSLSFKYNEVVGKTVTITTNAASWDATTTYVASLWLKMTKNGNRLTISPLYENSGSSRQSAIVTITAGSKSVTLEVTQEPFSLPFSTSSYNGSGTPRLYQRFGHSPGPSTWTGIIAPFTSTSRCRLSIWGERTISSYLNYSNGKFYISEAYLGQDAVDNSILVYFRALIFLSNSTVFFIPDYEVQYNSSTKTFNFGAKYDGFDVIVGIIGIDLNGDLNGIYAEGYTNAKIVLTSTLSTPLSGSDEVEKSAPKEAVFKSIKDVKATSVKELPRK